MKFRLMSRILLGLSLTLALAPVRASAQYSRAWTTVGSAGTVDEADTDKVIFTGGVAELNSTANSAVIRYNVVAVEGLHYGTGVPQLTARFRDNGEQARVIVRLKDYDLTTGFSNTLLILDSDGFAAAGGFQRQNVFDCNPGWVFNFAQKAYFVEVELLRSGVGGKPGLGIIQLDWTLC